MKKLLGIICIIALLFSCSALAEEAKEYNFHNIPWRSTSEKAIQVLIDGGFLPNEATMEEGYVASCPFLEEHKKLTVYPNSYNEYDKVMLSKSYSGSIIQKQIAGYDVNNIELSFGINGNETMLLIAHFALMPQIMKKVMPTFKENWKHSTENTRLLHTASLKQAFGWEKITQQSCFPRTA